MAVWQLVSVGCTPKDWTTKTRKPLLEVAATTLATMNSTSNKEISQAPKGCAHDW